MTGIIGRKIRMTQIFSADGSVVPVTAIETGSCVVVQKKEMQKDGYNALRLGFGHRKKQRTNKPQQGHMGKAGKDPFEILREFRIEEVSQYEVGQEIKLAPRIFITVLQEGHRGSYL